MVLIFYKESYEAPLKEEFPIRIIIYNRFTLFTYSHLQEKLRLSNKEK